jgi:hypothetical protein
MQQKAPLRGAFFYRPKQCLHPTSNSLIASRLLMPGNHFAKRAFYNGPLDISLASGNTRRTQR